MLKPRRKLIIGILLTLIGLMFIFLVVVVYGAADIGFFSDKEDDTEQLTRTESQLQGIMDTLDILEWNLSEVYDNFYSQTQIKADLAATALRQRVASEGDRSISMVGDGGIVRIENGTVRIPQGFRTGISKYADQITKKSGRLIYNTKTRYGNRKDILVYSRINGPYYYVEIVNGNELLSYIDANADYMDMLDGIEAAYGIRVYLICPDHENSTYFFNQPGSLVYSPNVYVETAMEALNRSTINAEDEGLPSDKDELLALDGQIGTDPETGESIRYIVREVDKLGCLLVLKMETAQLMQGMDDQVAAGLGFMLVMAVLYLVFITSVYSVMTSGIMTEEKKKKYSPARIRIITVSYGILSTILVFGFCVYVRALSSLYQEIEESGSILTVLDQKLDDMQEYEEILDKAKKNLYMEYGTRAAYMIDRFPQLNNKESLEEINSIIGSRFMILFDREGKEISSSADYINMELGDPKADHPTSTADFRKILNGVPGIAHSTFKDEVIGEELDLVGVRTNDAKSGQYGVLLLAFEPEDKERRRSAATNDIMQALIPAGEICFTVDLTTQKITHTTINDLIQSNMTIGQAGLKESMLNGYVTDFITISGIKHFCVSSMDADENVVRYILTPDETLFSNGVRLGLVYAISYALLFLILSLYLQSGYTNEKIRVIEAAQAEAANAANEEKGRKENNSPGRKWERMKATLAHWLGAATPVRKASLVLKGFLALEIVSIIRRRISSVGLEQEDALIYYILQGKWSRGLNLFALTAMILLALSITLGLMFVHFIIATIGKMLNPRGQTICQLISNMFSYMGILVFLYFALSYVGVDTNAILASVGVLGIGLSMGARDLIADIFAGVSTIFEGEYQVGDIVNINGYRGTVEEIGVRSTRIIGRGGNERIFSNKDITSVINLTKMNSWVAITIRVDVSYPLQDVEDILSEKLPVIGQNCKYIITGPIYKGVLSVEAGFAVLSIIAECREDNYHKVERVLNREVLLALREKQVPVK